MQTETGALSLALSLSRSHSLHGAFARLSFCLSDRRARPYATGPIFEFKLAGGAREVDLVERKTPASYSDFH